MTLSKLWNLKYDFGKTIFCINKLQGSDTNLWFRCRACSGSSKKLKRAHGGFVDEDGKEYTEAEWVGFAISTISSRYEAGTFETTGFDIFFITSLPS